MPATTHRRSHDRRPDPHRALRPALRRALARSQFTVAIVTEVLSFPRRTVALAEHIAWRRTLTGRNPSRVILAGSQVACSYIADQGKPGAPGRERLVCVDLRGNERWSIQDFRLQLAVREERYIGVTQSGQLRVVDVDGRESDGIRDGKKRAARTDVIEVRTRRDGLIVRTTKNVFVVDTALHVVDRFRAPATSSNLVVLDAAVMYVDHERVMRLDRSGRATAVCEVPTKMAHDAMTRWEHETGRSAHDGVWMTRIGAGSAKAEGRLLGIGDRLSFAAWYLHYDEAADSLFLVNHIQPHVIIALEATGHAKWCTYLNPHCCGGSPTRLPNGELVVSSGCGGIVSWLDPAGCVLRRSAFHGMLDRCVRALADSSCLIEGGSCLAFWADGTLRWQHGCNCFDYDEQSGLLVTASWTSENQTVTLECIESPDRDA